MRTSDRKWQTLKWSVIGAVAAGLLFAIIGCKSPTSPDEGPHPNEVKVLELTKCFAEYVEMPWITAIFQEEEYLVPCEPGSKDQCPAKGWALLPGHKIVFWGPFVRGEYRKLESWDLPSLVAHEIAHVELLTWNEIAAEYRGVIMLRDAGCA